MTIIEVEGAWNVRDVGGIAAAEGRVRSGVLMRSGNLAAVTAAGIEVIRARVRHIVDLRADTELLAQPTAVSGVPITHLPLFFGSIRSFFTRDVTLDELYRHILDEGTGKIVEAMRVIGAGESTLVHCTVGKDRTGVTVALALAAADAEREAVIADYALTESQLPPDLTRQVLSVLRSDHPDARNIETLATRSPAPVMRALLERIDGEFGSVADYLRAHGLTAGELRDLRAVLVDRRQEW